MLPKIVYWAKFEGKLFSDAKYLRPLLQRSPLNKTALGYNNNDNFIYPAKIDQLNLNIKTAGINLCAVDKIFQISVYLAIKKNYEND